VSTHYLPEGLPAPAQEPIAQPYWEATRANRLVVQKCNGCGKHQWGPEWICHRCQL
jgi:uncharacterized OB-fold protein